MAMALKADVLEACIDQGTEKPVDLVHLSKLTMGDKGLELEILKMFLAQIPNYISMIKEAQSEQEIYIAAHTLKGAASNVGAFKLANLARVAENSGTFDFQSILEEVTLITDYISMLSSEG